MSLLGSNTQGRSLPGLVMLAMLSGIVLMIYTYLKKMNSAETAIQVESLLKYYGFNDTLAKFATCQAAHETNGFTSRILQSNNNLFGMKYAGQSIAKGEKNGYAYYDSISGSVADFQRWYIKHRNSVLSFPLIITSLKSYVKFLKNEKYFEANEADYLRGCEYFYTLLYT